MMIDCIESEANPLELKLRLVQFALFVLGLTLSHVCVVACAWPGK